MPDSLVFTFYNVYNFVHIFGSLYLCKYFPLLENDDKHSFETFLLPKFLASRLPKCIWFMHKSANYFFLVGKTIKKYNNSSIKATLIPIIGKIVQFQEAVVKKKFF